ncbi:MAG: HNH endonuclease signature motif containing protein [Georgenia sp.]
MVTVIDDAPPETTSGTPELPNLKATGPVAVSAIVAPPTMLLDVPEDDEALAEEISSLAGRIAVATCRLLILIGELDARDAWASHGIMSCAHWLGWRCGMGPSSAREHVRVARALRDLPKTVDAFAAGKISYSKVRAITRVATPRNEADLVDIALCAPANHLERLVRGLRTAESAMSASLRHARRQLSWRWAEDGSLLLSGRFSPEDGAVIVGALEERRARAREEMAGAPPAPEVDPDVGGANPSDCPVLDTVIENGRSLADAMVEMCTEEPATGTNVVRTSRVVETAVHVTLADLATDGPATKRAASSSAAVVDAIAEDPVDSSTMVDDAVAAIPPQLLVAESLITTPRLEHGSSIAPETARRLACDGGIVLHIHENGVGVSGHTLEVGARVRKPGAALTRALWARDHGCRYPGCDRRRFINAHHVVHWADGGPTVLSNMVLLCGTHHRLLHEGGFSLSLGVDGIVRVRDADGHAVQAVPDSGCSAGTSGPAGIPFLNGPTDPWSLTPQWGGEPLHAGYATSVLLNAWAHAGPDATQGAAVA